MNMVADTSTVARSRAARLDAIASFVHGLLQNTSNDRSQVAGLFAGLRESVTTARHLNAGEVAVSHLLLVCANLAKGIQDGVADREQPMTDAEVAKEMTALRTRLNEVYEAVITQRDTERRRTKAAMREGAAAAPAPEAAALGITLNDFKDLDQVGDLIKQELQRNELLEVDPEAGMVADAVTYVQKHANDYTKLHKPDAKRGYAPARIPVLFQVDGFLNNRWFHRVGGIDKFVGVRETGARILGSTFLLENQFAILVHKDHDPAEVFARVKPVLPAGLMDVLDGHTISSQKLGCQIIWLMRKDTYAKIGPFVPISYQTAFDAHSDDLRRSQRHKKLNAAERNNRIDAVVKTLMSAPAIHERYSKPELRRMVEAEMRAAAEHVVDQEGTRQGEAQHRLTLKEHREEIERRVGVATERLRAQQAKAQEELSGIAADVKEQGDVVAGLKQELADKLAAADTQNANAVQRSRAAKEATLLKTRLDQEVSKMETLREQAKAARQRLNAIQSGIDAKTVRVRDDYRKELNRKGVSFGD